MGDAGGGVASIFMPFYRFFCVKLSYWLTKKKFQFVQMLTSLVCVTGGKKRHSLYVVPQE